MRKIKFLILLLLTLLVSVLPTLAQDTSMDIVDIAAADGRFSTLVTAVQAAGLVDTLKSEGPFTVFAPTDDAFAALPEGTVEGLLNDIPALTNVLLYHVVPGAVHAAEVVKLDTATTAQGSAIKISVKDGEVYLNDTVKVIMTDIEASNGVIHVIDGVLLPPAEAMTPEPMAEVKPVHVRVAHFSPDTPAVDVFVNGDAAIQSLEFPNVTGWIELPAGTYNLAVSPAGAGIDAAAIGPADFDLPAGAYVTVAAIGSLEAGTLAPQVLVEDYSDLAEGYARVSVFHAIEDAPAVDVLANGAPALSALAYPGTQNGNDGFYTVDVPAGTYDFQVVPTGKTEPVVLDLPGTVLEANTNYFVAAVGTLANPTAQLVATLQAATMADATPGNSIVDIAVNDGRFTTLVAALQAAGLTDTLAGEGPFTVFAPTDDAFAALPAGTVEGLLNDIPTLTKVLLYHVVSGEVPAATVVTLDSATTLEGSPVSITVRDGKVYLNDKVLVIMTDIQASNGIIHVIDGVLLPPTE